MVARAPYPPTFESSPSLYHSQTFSLPDCLLRPAPQSTTNRWAAEQRLLHPLRRVDSTAAHHRHPAGDLHSTCSATDARLPCVASVPFHHSTRLDSTRFETTRSEVSRLTTAPRAGPCVGGATRFPPDRFPIDSSRLGASNRLRRTAIPGLIPACQAGATVPGAPEQPRQPWQDHHPGRLRPPSALALPRIEQRAPFHLPPPHPRTHRRHLLPSHPSLPLQLPTLQTKSLLPARCLH